MYEYEPCEEQFKAYCYQLIREQIELIDPSLVCSIYALSFYVDDEPGENGLRTLTFGYHDMRPKDDRTCGSTS
jgi:hypothetical protein